MELVNPDEIRLVPGESFQAMFALGPDDQGHVGFFVRSAADTDRTDGNVRVLQRAGLIEFNDVLLVVTMIRLRATTDEFFDIWWNYHSPEGRSNFQRISEQDRLRVHFYSNRGIEYSVDTENSFRRFFGQVGEIFHKSSPWSEIEFHRAVRGFCSQSYPKQNLWEMIEFRPDSRVLKHGGIPTADDYPGFIPNELRPFYEYIPGQGHCIRIIPSMNEAEAVSGDPGAHLLPAPVKSVMRCGVRWAAGFPVAPIPFIPGIGLAVPPDDIEL